MNNTDINIKTLLKFAFPSLIGLLLFMTPIPSADGISIPVAVVSSSLQNILGSRITLIITALITLSAIISAICSILKPKAICNNEYLCNLFVVPPFWLIMRILGGIFALLAFTSIGPEFLISESTSSFILTGLLPTLFCIFLFAGILLPLLLDFGLMDLFGALMSKIMKPLFTLPGRASIDCVASWLGDGTIGVLLTNKQYEEGFYSKREASVISTTFSAVSITFSLVVISQVGLSHLFIPYYLTVLLTGIIIAVIVPRIPPLSKIEDSYCTKGIEGERKQILSFKEGFSKALDTAQKYPGTTFFLKSGLKNVIDMWLGILPIVMSMGTIALVLAEYTPIFQYLGAPFIPLLNLLKIPEAKTASETILVGFADMFIPSIIATSIKSEMTRFIIATLSVTQLIYISEVGSLILGSKIPLKLRTLFIIFLERTLISLPIITIVAHIIF